MKAFKKIVIISFLLLNSHYILSQTTHSSLRNKTDVNEKHGVVRAVYNIYEKQPGSSIEEKAKNYLMKNKELFGLITDFNDLVLTTKNESMGTKHLNYKQLFHGIEVQNSNITISFDKDEFVTMVVCDYFPIHYCPVVFVISSCKLFKDNIL